MLVQLVVYQCYGSGVVGDVDVDIGKMDVQFVVMIVVD